MHKVGFIGLGNMGKGMASNLANNNVPLTCYDIDNSVFSELKNSNIRQSSDLKELVDASEVVITMLPDGPIVKDVWKKVIDLAKKKITLIDCSTIDVNTSLEVQNRANEKGFYTLDAPVSGGVMGANSGTLTFMVGGKSQTYQNCRYLFEIMGNKSILCGGFGAGQSAKICNNMLLASTMIAVGESFKLGKNLGLDLEKLFDVLSTSSGSCWAVNTYCPIKGVGPNSPSDNDFKGGFASALMYKDLGLAIEAANQTETVVTYGELTHKKFEKIIQNGKGNLDFSNVINE